MSRKAYKSDDKPITSITVIEDVSACPTDYIPVTKTYDTDTDADLWRDNAFFSRKYRYICFSKSKSVVTDFILESLIILNEKDYPPEGYGLIPRTLDTDQKAWRKKQIAYKLTRESICPSAITDIIILAKQKIAPDGYTQLGDIAGMLVCYKTTPLSSNRRTSSDTKGLYNLSFLQDNSNSMELTNEIGKSLFNGASPLPYPAYENLSRPLPPLPTPVVPPRSSKSLHVSSSFPGLDGVPFVLNTNYESASKLIAEPLPLLEIKTKEELDEKYYYDFRVEKQFSSMYMK